MIADLLTVPALGLLDLVNDLIPFVVHVLHLGFSALFATKLDVLDL